MAKAGNRQQGKNLFKPVPIKQVSPPCESGLFPLPTPYFYSKQRPGIENRKKISLFPVKVFPVPA
jgi:hypothetical protein